MEKELPKFTSGKIFINPNFNSQVQNNDNITTTKMQPQPSTIYVNPAFFSQQYFKKQINPEINAEVIAKAKTKLVRRKTNLTKIFQDKDKKNDTLKLNPLIKIGTKKLIRTSEVQTNINCKPEFISRFALCRNTSSQSISKLNINSQNSRTHFHKKQKILNINGIIYKSTGTQLQRKPLIETIPNIHLEAKEKVIKVRGDRFVLDRNGKSLTRIMRSSNSDKSESLKRIDFGGLTYLAKSNKSNVFIRTDLHKARNHLSQARNRSITLLLSKNRSKNNIPCAVYRRLGKCSANEKGRCMKKHDPNQVVVCTKFLRGDCKGNCFLSHDVSLSKMPVCKFFLKGLCVRDDCPYLHKKINENAKICMEFQRGFCKLADKCDKLHENNIVCKIKNLSNNMKANFSKADNLEEISKESCRYFCDEEQIDESSINKNCELDESVLVDSTNANIEENIETDIENETKLVGRPKLGELPAFIPF